MVRGVGPGHDGLGPQRLQRPLVAGLGAQHTDDVVLQRELVDDGQAVAIRHQIERAVVLATVKPDGRRAPQAEADRADAVELDAAAARRGPHHRRAARGPGATELGDLDVGAAQLDRACRLHHRDPDRPRRGSRGGDAQDHEQRED
jgi:hypothetical protein